MSWFLTIEGLDGAGKTTQIGFLRRYLEARGLEAYYPREPGATALGEQLRLLLLPSETTTNAPEAEALLLSAARAQLVATEIRPRLARGQPVVCDRFADSTLAYQGYGRGLDLESLRVVTQFATGGLVPDLTVLLDLDEDEALRRTCREEASHNFFDRIGSEFRRRVRAGYLAMAADEPGRWLVLNARAPVDDIHRQMCAVVATRCM